MYQVLIADDERKDRNIVKILLQRRYDDKFHVFEAENGTQALEILRRENVQLLLLDINMPGISGIDVLHGLAHMPYVIMLTAYSQFSYTQEALRCGVRDYLLKPPLREEFYQAIDRFIQDQGRAQEQPMPYLQSREVFTRDLAQQMMYYGDGKKIEGLLQVMNIQGRLALCGIVRTEKESGRGGDGGCLLDEAEDFLNRCDAPYAAASCGNGMAVFIFCREEQDAPDALELFTQLAHYLESNLCDVVQIQTGPMALVPGGYPKAFLTLTESTGTSGKPPEPVIRQAELERAVRRRDFGAVMELLRPVLEALEDAEDEDLLKYQLLIVLSQCGRQVQSHAVYQANCHRLSEMIGAHGREQVMDIVAQYVQWLLEACQTATRPQNSTVQMVLEKVRQDCSCQWSIDSLAESLHVNAYYLSHLFKEHTGQCFTDYLAERRIERAVELMRTTDLNLAQIGERVGYHDPNYFSRVFKKHKGVGPREFSRGHKK